MQKLLAGAIASTLGVFGALAGAPALAAPVSSFANVVVIMDESGSMSGEQAWSGGMIVSLDAGLISAGLTGGNRYGLVGFGGGGAGNNGRQINVGGGQFGTAAQFQTATNSLTINGSTEDGWAGINFANGYTFQPGGARNFILVTDEDRDIANPSLTFAGVRDSLTGTGTLLNAIVNASFTCTGGGSGAILGVTAKGVGYRVASGGGFTTTSGCSASSGTGTTLADYVNLAFATGGAAWNLNLLRGGGDTAVSFTKAFIDLKVAEIIVQPPVGVPEPGTLGLLGLALAGVGATRRRLRR